MIPDLPGVTLLDPEPGPAPEPGADPPAAESAAGNPRIVVIAGEAAMVRRAAAVIAAGRPLWRVDLGAVISNYIGETEKHLDRLFAAAASAGAVLFFDEADALFGKRTRVGDAHDRHANIEVAHLLRRLEAHPMPAILAAKRARDIDPALLRRASRVVTLARTRPSPRP